MWLTFSRRAAIIIGILLPVAETIRRWKTWFVYPPNYIDDLSIGAFLLFAAWLSVRRPPLGIRYLAAAWAYACGMGYMSFFGHLANLNGSDPAPVPHAAVAAIIGCGWLFHDLCDVRNFARRPRFGTQLRNHPVEDTRLTCTRADIRGWAARQ